MYHPRIVSTPPALSLPEALRALALELGKACRLLRLYQAQLLPFIRIGEEEEAEDVATLALGMLQVAEREYLPQAIEALEEAANLIEGTAPYEYH